MAEQDPIVEETRALREQLMNEVGNDLDSLIAYLKEREALHPERSVSFPPRRPAGVAVGRSETKSTK